MEWNSTRTVLTDLEKLLTCKLCEDYLSDPCTLENCDHNFCRKCIEARLGTDSRCPECGAFSWLKDLKSNLQLATTVTMTIKLRSLIGYDVEGSVTRPSETHSENSIAFNSPEQLSESSVATKEQMMETDTLSSNRVEIDCEKTNDTEPSDLASDRITFKTVGCKPISHSRDVHGKKYLLRNKLKRQGSWNSDCPETTNKPATSYNELPMSSSKNKPRCASKLLEGKTKIKYRSRVIANQQNTGSEAIIKKGHFTHVRDKCSASGENDNQQKQVKQKPSTSNTAARKLGGKDKGSAVVEEKENMKLNVKRRKVKPRSNSIKEYLVEIENLDHSSDTCTPQKPTKSSNVSISSPQNSRNKKGETPLHLAAIKGDLLMAQQLIKEGASANVKDNAGWTPLHEACNHGHVDIVELFLDSGALINIPGFDNDTPLHDAVANGRLKVTKLLVKRGASLTARNKQGLLPKDYAVTEAMKSALSPPVFYVADDVAVSKKPDDYHSGSKVIVATALSHREKEILEKSVLLLGGTIVDEFSESATHVITSINKKGHCPRTMKYFFGILTGKWVLRFTWITDCLKKRKWISEETYEVQGTDGPKKSRYNMMQQLPRLFNGCSFFLRGSFKRPTPGKEDLINLIQLGGGNMLHREPKVKDDDLMSLPSSPIVTSLNYPPEVAYHAPANSSLSCCTKFIIFDPTVSGDTKIIYSPVLCTAPVTWLMDCISAFEFLDIPDNTKK